MVDFFLVLMLAGAGDELQGIKKGILELADAIAITKADGDNMDKARQAAQAYANALHLLAPASAQWQPPVTTCSALTLDGVGKVWDHVLEHRQRFEASGELAAKRRRQALAWMDELVAEGLRLRFKRHPEIRQRLQRLRREVADGQIAPTAAAEALLFFLDNPKPI
jgi:LAO/AO transport system kinase